MSKVNLLWCLFLVFFVQGCGLIGENNGAIVALKKQNKIVVAQQLQMGISEAETRGLFNVKMTYASAGEFMRPEISVPNPYKTEIVLSGDSKAKVLWYYTQMVKNDSKITEDELTPVVLIDDKVIGWGHNFLNDYCRYKN